MSPTRELAKQIAEEFAQIGPFLKTLVMYGGTKYDTQMDALRRGIDVLVGTPGRIIDHLERKSLKLEDVEVVVLDEADEMLNIGFADSIEKILNAMSANLAKAQVLLFSATIPSWIHKVSKKYLKPNKVQVDVVGTNKTPSQVRHLACPCVRGEQRELLPLIIQVYGLGKRTIVFTNTKAEANEIATNSSVRLDCQVLHGDIAQEQREVTLAGFRTGKFGCLVATDVAARGLDIKGVDLVIQCQPPESIETYIHRAGRTGRAGEIGTVITLYQKRFEYAIKRIAGATGITFEYISAPQPEDIVKATTAVAVKSILQVGPETIQYFESAAKELLEDRDAVETVAAALALITGTKGSLGKRSLLTSRAGYTTLLLSTTTKIFSPLGVLHILRALLNDTEHSKISDIALCLDEKKAVFDVPNELVEQMLSESSMKKLGSRGQQLKEISVLPPVKARPDLLPQRSSSYGGRGRESSRGGGGGRGGGRGSFRGGGGGGGRGRSSFGGRN